MSRNLMGKKREKIFDYYRYLCVYCGDEATVLDHIIPYDHIRESTEDNLVPACATCNGIASDMMFDSFEEKKEYILSRRNSTKFKRKSKTNKSECTNCGKFFRPRNNLGSTMFLCEECVDLDYERKPGKVDIKQKMEKYILSDVREDTSGCPCRPPRWLLSDFGNAIE